MTGNTQEKEVLKVREYLGIVVELRSDNTQKSHREIIKMISDHPDVSEIRYQRRTVERIIVLPESETKGWGGA